MFKATRPNTSALMRKNIHKKIINVVYTPAFYYLDKTLANIVNKNFLVNGVEPQSSAYLGVLYKGCQHIQETYLAPKHNPLKGWKQVIPAHPSIEEEIEKYSREYKELLKEKDCVSRGLSIILSEPSLTSSTLSNLLGDNIYSIVQKDFERVNSDPKLDKENLIQNQDKKLSSSKSIKQVRELLQNRLVSNLISQGLYND